MTTSKKETSFNREYVDAKLVPREMQTITSFQVEDAATLDRMLKDGQIKQVKAILRSHHWPIDHPIRKELWVTLARFNRTETHDPDFYGNTVNELLGKRRVPIKLPAFVDPIYGTHYYLNERGQRTVERILGVVCESCPGITYAPLLYPLVSLFLHYMPEEEAFYCISDLLSAKREDFISLSRASHDGKCGMAISLAKKYAVRLIDCFLLEGSKVILRILLAVLVLHSKYSGLQTKSEIGGGDFENNESLSLKILNFCKSGLDPMDKFFKIAFGIRGLSRKEISKLSSRAEIQFSDQGKAAMPTSLSSSDSLHQLQATMPYLSNGMKRVLSQTGQIGPLDFDDFKSGILTTDQMAGLWSWLPVRFTALQPRLLYSTDEHGSCLTAFFARVDTWEPTILLVKANNDDIFGAFCSTSWSARSENDEEGNQKRYFGTGETFVFTIHPKAQKFPWVGLKQKEPVSHSAELFMAANRKWICIGSGNGNALWLDGSLNAGQTEHCDTFNNPPLCSLGDFTSKLVEVISFE